MYGNNYPILDALILLPSLGFPAIAEKREDGNYEIFVSMLCITPANKSVDFTLCIPEILGIEKFKSHLVSNSDLDNFSNKKITKFLVPSNRNQNIIKILKLNSEKVNKSGNKFYWIPQKDFIKIANFRGKKEQVYKGVYKDAYEKAKNLSNTSNLKVHHVEFMLTLPKKKKSGLYNLVCKHERESYKSNKSSFQYFLKNMIKYKGKPDLSKTIDGKPIIPYHPVYIPKEGKKYLNIAHISDTHVSRRWDAMAHWASKREEEYKSVKQQNKKKFEDKSQKNLVISIIKCFPKTEEKSRIKNKGHFKREVSEEKSPWKNFNNPNRRFEEALQKANEDSNVDIIIITGDLIDYNMGYCGDYKKKDSYFKHGIESYYPNYNWVLFYELLLKNYNKPVFTILGNHDYRLNPYGIIPERLVTIPTSSPVPSSIYTPPAKVDVVRLLGININYADDLGIQVKNNNLKCFKGAVDFIYPQKMRKYSSLKSIKTSYENVKWYNLVINPALDYMFTYGDMGFVFLDWHREEEMLGFKRVSEVQIITSPVAGAGVRAYAPTADLAVPENEFGLPWAKNMLTKEQQDMIKKMIEKLKNKKKNGALPTLIVSMHPTVFCEPKMDHSGGTIKDDDSRDDDEPEHLACGNFRKCRLWFIEQMYGFKKSGGRAIVLSGHAHKNRVYAIEDCKVSEENKDDCGKNNYNCKGCRVLNIIITKKSGNVVKYNPLFIVTTSTAYISKEANSPGFRVLTFKDQKLKISLVSLKNNIEMRATGSEV